MSVRRSRRGGTTDGKNCSAGSRRSSRNCPLGGGLSPESRFVAAMIRTSDLIVVFPPTRFKLLFPGLIRKQFCLNGKREFSNLGRGRSSPGRPSRTVLCGPVVRTSENAPFFRDRKARFRSETREGLRN